MRRLAWEQKYHALRSRVKLAIGGEDDAYELSEQIEEAYQNDELSGAGYENLRMLLALVIPEGRC